MLVTRILGLFLVLGLVAPVVADDAKTEENKSETSTTKVEKSGDQRIAASRVIGASVYGSNQEDTIGSVNDIVTTKDGKVVYLVIGSGGLAGVGETNHGVPAKAVDLKWVKDGDEKTLKVSLPMTAEDLENAPALSLEHAADLTVDSFQERNSKYFKAQNAEKVKADNMFLVSEMMDLDVKGNGGESVGAIEDIVFNHKEVCEAAYFIMGSGGTLGIGESYTAIPAKKLKVTKTKDDQYTAMIDADKKVIGAAPKVTSDKYYAELENEETRSNVDKAFAEAGSTDKE
ncbi:PRC-barrel domain-containing protein [Bremerella cremea]|uniref:PRC-barrel domain-containing protein n=1 Tax=Bremerella cremea TaxID=1031537 RepID=UPI0031F0B64A